MPGMTAEGTERGTEAGISRWEYIPRAAFEMGLPEAVVRNLIKRGIIRVLKFPGQWPKVNVAELRETIAAHTMTETPPVSPA